MARTLALLTLAVTGIASVYGGQIQIGQTVSGVNQGLTTVWMTNTAGAACAGCIQNLATTGWNNNTIQLREFVNSTPVAAVPGKLTDNHYTDGIQPITFDMMNGSEGAVNASNMWYALNGTNPLTIPVGVFGVKSVWTMINDVMGTTANGGNQTDISFYFANTQNGVGATESDLLTLHLVNGQQVESSVLCSPSCGFVQGLNSDSTLTATNSTTGSVTGPATVQVLTSNLYSSIYTGGSATPYTGTSGKLVLDDQGFIFGNAFANLYLVDIMVKNVGNNAAASRTAVNAVTVLTSDVVATPEPAAITLLLGGCAAIGLLRRRKSI